MSDDSKKTVFRKIVIPDELKKKFLVGNTPPYLGKPYELAPGGEFSVGREEGRTLQLASDMVSRNHASIGIEDGKPVLVDLESANGTYVNNEQIEPKVKYVLSHRDIIRFDTFEFIYVDTAVGDLWQTLKPLSREGTQIISFYSPKGGTGITSIVVNLAHLLAGKSEKRVAVVDLDLRFGDIITYVSGKTGLTINELLQEQQITPDKVQEFMHKGPGFDFLQAPKKVELAELVKGEHVKSILWSLQAKYDYVLVDLKSEIDDVSITAWELSNLIFLVGSPEFGNMIAIRKVLDIMNSFKFPDSKIKLIINRFGRPLTLSDEELRSALGRDYHKLPYSPSEAVVTSNGGKLFVTGSTEPLSQALVNLKRTIEGEETVVANGGVFSRLKSMLGL